MAENDKIVEFINHYKNSIERNNTNRERILHCLTRLAKLKVNVSHLQQTGIGKTVNGVRKLEGEVGELAKKLVMSWKDMVSEAEAAEKAKPPVPLFKLPIKIKTEESDPMLEIQSSSTSSTKETQCSAPKNKSEHSHKSSRNGHSSSSSHNDKKSKEKSSDKHHHKKDHKHHTSHKEKSSKPKHENAAIESKENKSSSHSKEKTSKREHETKSKSSSSSSKSRDKSVKKQEKLPSEKIDKELDASLGIGFEEALALFDIPSSSKKKDKEVITKTVPVKSSESATNSSKAVKRPATSDPSTSQSSKKFKTLTAPPKLLCEKPKLEPLPDIVSDLPSDVSIPDYRPMPLSSAVKDYINSSVLGSSSSQCGRPQKQMSDADLLTESFSSKANRTRVYSGNRVQKTVPTLFNMSIRVLQENIEFMTETGGVPFDILKPVLEKAKPEQLSNIEYYNPYLLDESDVLWEPHCKRKFRTRKRLEMESWRDMYDRCTREDEEKLSRLTQNIRQHQEHTSNGVQKTMLAYVDSMVKPPRNIMRKQEIYGTNRKLVVSPAARTEGLKNLAPNLAAPGDARLRVAAGLRDDAQAGRFFQRPVKKAPLMAKVLSKFKR